jgi:hypothetical protein
MSENNSTKNNPEKPKISKDKRKLLLLGIGAFVLFLLMLASAIVVYLLYKNNASYSDLGGSPKNAENYTSTFDDYEMKFNYPENWVVEDLTQPQAENNPVILLTNDQLEGFAAVRFMTIDTPDTEDASNDLKTNINQLSKGNCNSLDIFPKELFFSNTEETTIEKIKISDLKGCVITQQTQIDFDEEVSKTIDTAIYYLLNNDQTKLALIMATEEEQLETAADIIRTFNFVD